MLKLLTSLFVAGLAAMAYLSFKYDTSRPCEAFAEVIAEETPGALDQLSDKWLSLRIRGLVGRVFDAQDEFVQRLAENFVLGELDAFNGAECMGGVLAADFNRDWFQGQLASHLEDEARNYF